MKQNQLFPNLGRTFLKFAFDLTDLTSIWIAKKMQQNINLRETEIGRFNFSRNKVKFFKLYSCLVYLILTQEEPPKETQEKNMGQTQSKWSKGSADEITSENSENLIKRNHPICLCCDIITSKSTVSLF